jgi:hypothetical protein
MFQPHNRLTVRVELNVHVSRLSVQFDVIHAQTPPRIREYAEESSMQPATSPDTSRTRIGSCKRDKLLKRPTQ